MDNTFFDNKILLNSARNCLKYILRAYKIPKIHLPYYICPVVRQAIREENVKMEFYHIDKFFMPKKNFAEDEYILYPNYFGLCDEQSEILSKKNKNLILDNAHAFFAPQKGLASFSSPRKFFNVNDGGILEINTKISENFAQDEDRTLEIKDFESFCKNEFSIDDNPIKFMSEKTKNSLKNINFDEKISKNRKIFSKIDQKLKKTNILNLHLLKNSTPMCYPFLTEDFEEEEKIAKMLEKEGIYLIKYGSNLPETYPEFEFTKILMIPLIEKTLKFFD